jgi:hypothetical protein
MGNIYSGCRKHFLHFGILVFYLLHSIVIQAQTEEENLRKISVTATESTSVDSLAGRAHENVRTGIFRDALGNKYTSTTLAGARIEGTYHYNPIIDMITIQAGVAFSILYGVGQQDAQFTPAFFFGAGLRLPVVTRIYIDPSIKFAQAGSNYKQGDKYKLGYVDVDADAEFDWCDPDMYGEIGVTGRINTSADLKYNGNSYNEKQYFKSTDAGVNARLGWKVTRKFAVFGSFYLGLINTYNTTNTTGTGKNMSFGFGGRYCLN